MLRPQIQVCYLPRGRAMEADPDIVCLDEREGELTGERDRNLCSISRANSRSALCAILIRLLKRHPFERDAVHQPTLALVKADARRIPQTMKRP